MPIWGESVSDVLREWAWDHTGTPLLIDGVVTHDDLSWVAYIVANGRPYRAYGSVDTDTYAYRLDEIVRS